jgi:predicted nucleotidyltransferase
MRARSPDSAGAIYLDKGKRLEDLRKAAAAARLRMPLIRRVILFGSLAAGRGTPRSDADILVVLDGSPHEQPRDRVPEVLHAFSPLPCPIDLFVLTSAEFELFRSQGSPLLRTVETTGLDLL